jgi:D-serine deaminase-like pyridoxal phosphate-dependent protein
VVEFAWKLRQLPGIELVGIYAHEMGARPTPEGKDEVAFEAATITCDTAQLLRKEGFELHHISVGGSPTFRSTCRFRKEGKFPELTEIHPGQCVIGDIMYQYSGGNTRESIAVTVLTTVMSTSHAEWAIVDAGYKTLGGDSLIVHREKPGFFWKNYPSFGAIKGRPDLWLGRLSAETSIVYYKEPDKKVKFGERMEIIPNNATMVINIHDQIYGVRKGRVEQVIPVTGRGRGN